MGALRADREFQQGEWLDKHAQVRAKLGVGPNYRPWSRHSPKCSGVSPTNRAIDAIDLAWASRPLSQRTLPFYVDVSQCPSRGRWGPGLRTSMQNTRWYSYELDRLLLPDEMAFLMGLPIEELDLSEFTQTQLYERVGEAMFAPCVATVLMAVFMNPHAPWWARCA